MQEISHLTKPAIDRRNDELHNFTETNGRPMSEWGTLGADGRPYYAQPKRVEAWTNDITIKAADHPGLPVFRAPVFGTDPDAFVAPL